MKPAAFAYAKARTLGHAIELLGADPDGAKVLAGGQSLIATLNMRLSAPRLLVDINGLDSLKEIAVADGRLAIGALVRHAPLIAKAMPHIAHPAIRNRGTIGGSLAFADPAAELPACLLALDGEVEIAGPKGPRSVRAGDFFRNLFETALAPDEVLTAVRIPVAGPDTRVGFAELARRHGDYAMIGLAAAAKAHSGQLADVRLAYFGVAATPVRARHAEAALAQDGLEHAVAALDRDLDPAGDLHASAAAKRHWARVLLRRVTQQLEEPRA